MNRQRKWQTCREAGTQSHGALEVSRATERKQSAMGDFGLAGSAYSLDDSSSAAVDLPVPPQLLARWAAIASQRACFGILPTQASTQV